MIATASHIPAKHIAGCAMLHRCAIDTRQCLRHLRKIRCLAMHKSIGSIARNLAVGAILAAMATAAGPPPTAAEMPSQLGSPGFQSPLIPPLGPTIVPPLLPGPCCGPTGNRPPHHRPPGHGNFFLFPGYILENQDYTNLPSGSYSQGPKEEAVKKATVAPPDFQPHLVTVTPPAAEPGDQVSVTIVRPGQPDQIVIVPRATTAMPAQ